MPSRPRAGHIDVISRGIHKLEELLAEMEKDEKTLKANNQAIFHNNTLKAWATEQEQYDEASINQIVVLKTTVCDNLKKLLSTKEYLQSVEMPSINKWAEHKVKKTKGEQEEVKKEKKR